MSAFRKKAKLETIEPVADELFRLQFDAPELADRCHPGQFVMVGPLSDDHFDPFLNRPFSIHRVLDQKLQLLVALVGRGTQLLTGMPIGKSIPMLGPLGRGFWLPQRRKTILFGSRWCGHRTFGVCCRAFRKRGRALRLVVWSADTV